jgi:hypothetical protein
MLLYFAITGFRNFEKRTHLDFAASKDFDFNNHVTSDGIVKNSIVIGDGGTGKTNLGKAILDITKLSSYSEYDPTLYNYRAKGGEITFEYKFKIDDHIIEFNYIKTLLNGLKYEELKIDNEVIEVNLSGTSMFRDKLIFSDNPIILNFLRFIKRMRHYNEFSLVDLTYKLNNNSLKRLREFVELFKMKFNIIDYHSIPNFIRIASSEEIKLLRIFVMLEDIRNNITSTDFLYIDEIDSVLSNKTTLTLLAHLNDPQNLWLRNIQFIITSKRTCIITNDLFRPDCYFISNDSFKRLHETTNKQLKYEHNLEKIFRSTYE